jgi:hypothetical protein
MRAMTMIRAIIDQKKEVNASAAARQHSSFISAAKLYQPYLPIS